MKTMINLSDMFHDDYNVYCYNLEICDYEGLRMYTELEQLEKRHPRIAKVIKDSFKRSKQTSFVFKRAGVYIQIRLI
jgi:hypothetical protein